MADVSVMTKKSAGYEELKERSFYVRDDARLTMQTNQLHHHHCS